MKKLLFIVLAFYSTALFAQESNNGKKLWAKSVLNEKAPALTVEKWLSKQPNTEGKFVLIDFWATWCGPCRKYIPLLNTFNQKYSDKLVIIGLSDETEDKVKAFKDPKIEYAEAIDTKNALSKQLEVKGIPHVIIIDPKGVVRWEGFPLLANFELTEKVLTDLMEKYKN